MSNSTLNQNQSFLEKIDIFGVQINFRFNKQNKHKTRFGGFVTLALLSVLFLLLSQQIKQAIELNSPKVIFEQQIVSNPSKYDLNKKNFSFVMSLYNSNQAFISDPSIFRFQAIFQYKVPFTNPDGSKGQPVLQQKNMEIEACHENSFQVQGTESYFKNLDYKNMFCFKNIDDFYFVGQFENDEFSVISITVIVCDDSDPQNTVKCMEATQKNKILQKSSLQIYYSNFVVKLQNKAQPFESVGQTQFWNASTQFLQKIDMTFIKTFIQDDDSLVLSNSNSQNQLLFSNYRSTLLTKTTNAIFTISLFLEKNREQTYFREYPKLSDMFSKVGGLFNVLFVFGCIIAQPYSQFQLNRKLFNSTFEISKDQKNQDKINNQQNKINISEMSENLQQSKGGMNFPKFDFVNESQNKGQKHKKEKNKKQSKNVYENKKFDQSIKDKGLSVFDLNEKEEANQKQINKNLKQVLKDQMRNVKIKTSEFFYYYLSYFRRFKSEIYQVIDFGTQQILDFTDVCFVVNKLIELEKLKTVILNDEQIKLFEFIPRPQIDIQLIRQLNNIQQNQLNLHQKACMTTNVASPRNQINNNQIMTQVVEDSSQQQIKQFNFLSIKNSNIQEKAKQAQEAFNKIYNNQQKQSELDVKLIQMLDNNLLMLLKNNKLNENNIQLFQLQNSRKSSATLLQLLGRMERHQSIVGCSTNLNKSGQASRLYQQQENFETNREANYDIELNELRESGIQLYQNRPKNFIDQIEQKNIQILDTSNSQLGIKNDHPK